MRALNGLSEVGECPFWHDGHWIWVDNFNGTVLRSKGKTTTQESRGAACAIPRRHGAPLIVQSTQIDGHAAPDGTRFNDGKCDQLGRLWIGTTSQTGQAGQGVLFRYDGRDLIRMADGFDVCNGLGWSPDYTFMYFTDTGKRIIYRYDFNAIEGTLGERQTFHHFESGGKPDGLAVDAEGCVWVALWDGGSLIRLSPEGKIIDDIIMPVPRPTSLAFGEGEMLVTSARWGLSDAQRQAAPKSGLSFLMQSPVNGMPVQLFAA